jgi:NADPH:quinone reductase-like Zn-dependent oxidoreductase
MPTSPATSSSRFQIRSRSTTRRSIIGVNWGGEVMGNPRVVKPVIEQLIDWSKSGVLSSGPDAAFPLERTGEAFGALPGRQSTGKIVIRP